MKENWLCQGGRILWQNANKLRPDTVMPYMVGTTEEVEKGWYLRRYGVPTD